MLPIKYPAMIMDTAKARAIKSELFFIGQR
jgi:hypothetical protein